MPDSRFFTTKPPLNAGDVCALIGGKLTFGEASTAITGVAPAASVKAGEASFIQKQKQLAQLADNSRAVILTTPSIAPLIQGAACVIEVANPRAAFARVAAELVSEKPAFTDNRGACFIDDTAMIDASAIVSAFCTIGPNVIIGAGSVLEPSTSIGTGVEIGQNCIIGSAASLQKCLIGSGVTIGANCTIGKAGFGFELTADGAVPMPHLGRVIIGDNCSIGANCTIDRGVMDDTMLGDGVMIDNLVHLAHNVVIGARTIILGQVGIGGSAVIGSDCIIGGQSGIADHVEIQAKIVILSRSGVTKSLTKSGTYTGFPAQIAKQAWREQAEIRKIAKQQFDKGQGDDR